MVVIVPAAGLSTRFPGYPPKYLLRDKKGSLMLDRAIQQYRGRHKIIVGVLRKHVNEHNAEQVVKQELGSDVNLVILENTTDGPADTVRQIIEISGLNDSSILIKDCDSFFTHEYVTGNFVCVANAKEYKILFNLSAKSFVLSNNQGILTEIVEKKIVSELFCVGGYGFNSSKEYLSAFNTLRHGGEVFVSHIIQIMLHSGSVFKTCQVKNYTDTGTLEAWVEFNNMIQQSESGKNEI